jgi:hypothetical protein
MTKQLRPIALVACIAALSSISTPSAQSKQQCNAARPSDTHGRWWSYRLIDERKCWYEGKPMLSKSELEWPKLASAKPDSTKLASAKPDSTKLVSTKPDSTMMASVKPDSKEAIASSRPDKPGDPMNAQARAPAEIDSFDARWRARIEQAILEEFGWSAGKPRVSRDRRL